EDAVNERPALNFAASNRKLFNAIIFCSFAVAFFISLAVGWKFVLFGFVLNTLGLFYSATIHVPALGIKPMRIKNMFLIKNVYASLFWSAALLAGPFVYEGRMLPVSNAYVVMAIFLWAVYVELLWDTRDVAGDFQAKVMTLPVRLGGKATR